MSKNNRGRFSDKTREQQALLDELDSLKALLNKEKEKGKEDEEAITAAPWEYTPPAKLDKVKPTAAIVPDLKEAVDIPPPTRPPSVTAEKTGKSPPDIPLLEEVVLPTGNRPGKVPELTEVVEKKGKPDSALPAGKELRHLVDMLVERQLNKLKPVVTRQIITELERLYPSLKKR